MRNPDQLVELLSRYPGDPRRNYFGWTDYERYRDRSETLSDLTGMAPARLDVGGDGFDTEVLDVLDAEYVVGTYFPVLGVQPAIGRLIAPDDDEVRTGDPAVVVLSWPYWRDCFNLDPTVAGTRIVVNGVPATVMVSRRAASSGSSWAGRLPCGCPRPSSRWCSNPASAPAAPWASR